MKYTDWSFGLLHNRLDFNTAAAQVGFMLTYQRKCNIVAEITVSKRFPPKKRRRYIILAMLYLG